MSTNTTTQDDLDRIVGEASRTLSLLRLRLYDASSRQDEAEVRRLWKQILSVERRCQERAQEREA